MTDAFADRAKTWDSNPVRVAVAQAFLEAALPLAGKSVQGNVLDFGCGTGLIGVNVAPLARRVDMLDTSPAMIAVLREKLAAQDLGNITVHLGELSEANIAPGSADLVLTAMALHHVADIPQVLAQLHAVLVPGGQLIAADLLPEDGSFHAPNSVPHNGFDPAELAELLNLGGFDVLETLFHHTMRKHDTAGALRDYPQFLLHARKR